MGTHGETDWGDVTKSNTNQNLATTQAGTLTESSHPSGAAQTLFANHCKTGLMWIARGGLRIAAHLRRPAIDAKLRMLDLGWGTY